MLLFGILVFVFFFKQKTAYEMRISDWSSDVCSSDLHRFEAIVTAEEVAVGIDLLDFLPQLQRGRLDGAVGEDRGVVDENVDAAELFFGAGDDRLPVGFRRNVVANEQRCVANGLGDRATKSEEHTSELQSLMSISYA